MKIIFERDAAKHISKMDKPSKTRIKQAIDKLPAGDVKKLQGFVHDYRLRVGDLRILFSVEVDTIIMSKEMLKGLIDLIDEEDMETIFRVLVRFVPEDKPMPDEVQANQRANKSIAEQGTVSNDEIDWN